MKFADRLDRIEPSITLELDARAKAMAAAGRDIVNLSVGEPDQPAPALVRAAAVTKVESGDVRYTPAAGTPSLRKAIADHITETRGVAFEPAEVTVCHSAKHALSGTLFSLVQEGDDVLIPMPSWASYVDLVRVTGAEAVAVPPREDGIAPDLDALRAAVTPRARVVMINSPNNPSGYVWTRAEIEEVSKLALEHGLWLISDEIYRPMVYSGEPAVGPLDVVPEAKACTALIDGASKRFAMTGYRIGFVAGPAELASAVARLHSQTAGSPNAVGQAAYERALLEEPVEVEQMRQAFAHRRELVLAGLEKLGLRTPEPRGAFYAFPDVSDYLDERGTVGFCADLLEDEGVALVPGSAFGREGHVRLSYAAGEDKLAEGLRRIGSFLEKLRK